MGDVLKIIDLVIGWEESNLNKEEEFQKWK